MNTQMLMLTRKSLLHHSIVVLVVLGIIAVATIPVGLMTYVAEKRAQVREYEALSLYARRGLTRIEMVYNNARDALGQMQQLTAEPCSDEYMADMRRVSLMHRYVQDVVTLRDRDYLMCGAMLGRFAHQNRLGKPSWEGPHYRVWLHAYDIEDTGKPMLMIADDTHAVLLDPESLVDVVVEDPTLSLSVVGTGTNEIVASWHNARPDFILKGYKESGKRQADGVYYITVKSAQLPIAVVAGEPSINLLRHWYAALQIWLPVGVVLGLAIAAGLLMYIRSRSSLVGQLRYAIRRRQLQVHYQPIVDLATRRCIGAEALVRWPQARDVMVRPDVFVPLAEDNQLIQPLTDLVLDLVCKDMATLLQLRSDLYVSINLAAIDLSTDRFCAVLKRTLAACSIEPQRIAIEATERGFMHAQTAVGIIQQLRQMGHRVLIDDFGTGYSGLSYLQTFQVDVLKIDKSFIDTVGTEAATASVAPHIVEIGHSLHLKMIAEGVESEAQAAWLVAHGVQSGQGWLFGKPMPAQAFLDYLNNERQRTRHV
ncbi:sensor c-di-GMP phosphodiesterase-like protein [Silvimonas terrae]|uniref:cyclic-guanylate-specific phosphodiesterase n=1 Tax=Silvimonas terrae TaxID=300266 RepID=A0A840RC46_9NEIS|nr:EAL domain-containing protein [Silvimonas terrae]MBB5190517.1 sensor c-di-GMP phosphodiesterase-like protein [Silvimonas terrae]